MGQGASQPELPPVCDKISRRQFQNKLLDIYAAFMLRNHYMKFIKTADLDNNGRPPKIMNPRDAKNFDSDSIGRIKRRAARRVTEAQDKAKSANLKQLEAQLANLEVKEKDLDGEEKIQALQMIQVVKENIETEREALDQAADDTSPEYGEQVDFKLYLWFMQFDEKYNNAEGDSARFQLLHEAVEKTGEVLHFYVQQLNDICENADQTVYTSNLGFPLQGYGMLE